MVDGDGDGRKVLTGRRGRVALVVAAAAGLAAVAVAGRWATHPSAFGEGGNKVTMPTSVGGAVTIGLAIYPGHRVTVREVKPVVSGTARADVTVRICELRDEGGTLGAARGADLSRFCREDRPVAGYALESGGRVGYVIATITPLSPGTVVIDRSRVRYVDGLQRGVQLTGNDAEITVS